MAVIYILWLRQLKRYVRARARVIGGLAAQPLLFLFAMGFGFGPTFESAGGGTTSSSSRRESWRWAILFTAVFSGIEILWDRQFGFLKETLVAPVSRFQIVLGRTLGGATVAVIQGLIVFCVCLLAGFRVEHPALLPVALVFMFLIAILFTAIGTAIGSLLEDMQAFPLIMNFLVMPLFFFSGALFPLHGLPRGLEVAVRLDPMTYGVDGLRAALSHGYQFTMAGDFAVLAGLTAVMLWVGSYCFSRIQL